MKISRQLMQLMLQQLKDLGHPDPLTLLARISVDTSFEATYDNGKGNVGFAGVSSRAAKRIGLVNFTEVEDALNAATFIDAENYSKVGGSIDRMLIAWRKGVRIAKSRKKFLSSERRWLGKIKSERKNISVLLGMSEPEVMPRSETASDIELKDAFTSQSFVIDKRVPSDSLVDFFFPEAERAQDGEAILGDPVDDVPVQIDHKERMISMLIEMVDLA